MRLSNKIQELKTSPVREFNRIAKKAKESGKKIYHLNIGQPDIETPECFMEAIKNYDEKVIAYADPGGEAVLIDAISRYFKTYGMDYNQDEILITTSGSEALTFIFLSILDPGEEVLVAEPFYANYYTFSKISGGIITPITTKAEEGYHYADREKIEKLITPKTRGICCISPGNPTGNVLSLEEMKLIGIIAKEHDLWIIADEVYREFAYDNREITSFGMLEDLKERVIIVDSVSKRFSACGARIGCIISKNRDLMENAAKLTAGRLSSPTLDQIGSAALYELGSDYFDKMKAEYEARRDVVYEELMKIPGVICQKPGGAFYITVKLPVDDAEKFLVFMLSEFEDRGETVMFTPAKGFYGTPGLGKDEMRLAYVLNRNDMRRGVELIRLGIEQYNKR